MAKHGTNRMYSAHGCRCEECRAFKREDGKRRRARRKQMAIEGIGDVPHGTPAGFDKYYCRCGDCGAAHRTYMRAWNEAHPESAIRARRARAATFDGAENAGKQWTGVELEQVIRRDLSLTELARRLGRTYDACSVARSKAENDPKWMAVVGTAQSIGGDE